MGTDKRRWRPSRLDSVRRWAFFLFCPVSREKTFFLSIEGLQTKPQASPFRSLRFVTDYTAAVTRVVASDRLSMPIALEPKRIGAVSLFLSFSVLLNQHSC